MYFTAVAIPSDELKKAHPLSPIAHRTGFDIIEQIDGVDLAALKLGDVRKGQWSVLFIADIMPLAPSKYNRNIENERIFVFHKELRKYLSKKQSMLVARASCADALADALLPSARVQEMQDQIYALYNEYQTTEDVVKLLANSTYDKVEIIKKGNTQYVKKTFRRYAFDGLRREIECRQALAHLSEVSPLVDSGENYIVLPYYEHVELMSNPYKPFPLQRLKKVLAAVEKIWDNGYAMLDCHPVNFLYLPDGDVKVIDFEFTVKHHQSITTFADSFFFSTECSPLTDTGTIKAPWRSWNRTWRPMVAYDYDELNKHCENPFYYSLVLFARKAPRLLARGVRNKQRAIHQARIRRDETWHYLPFAKRLYF